LLRRYRHNFLVDFVAQLVFGDFQIILCLQVHPGLRGHAEQAAKAHRGVGGDGAFAGADFIYAALGDAGEFCDLGTTRDRPRIL